VNLPKSAYIHIPFCSSICGYCDFCKLLYRPDWAEEYLLSLKKEICDSLPKEGALFETIYVGGGTPTSLEDEEFRSFLLFLSSFLAKGGEFTVEANPESLSESKAKIMAEAGVNRLSVGLESSHPTRLAQMGRRHRPEDVVACLKRARENGIANLNVDLIYALPGETMAELKEDIAYLLSLGATHISTYSLTIPEGTVFHNRGYREAPEDDSADQYEEILRELRAAGYERYEVSNFAKPGFRSRHNQCYWKDEEYYGFGLGASGYVGGVRYTNVKSLSSYLKGKRRAEEEKVTPKDDLEYFLLTNLRLSDGFSLTRFEKRFGFSFDSHFKESKERMIREGLLVEEGGFLRASDHGMEILDRILLALFP